jgi:hypothetical protein
VALFDNTFSFFLLYFVFFFQNKESRDTSFFLCSFLFFRVPTKNYH